jgi:lactoylglutathione lyase
MSPRPFRVLGVQQIAIGGLDKQPLLKLWSELLGLPVRGEFESASENVSEAILELGVGAARVELDLMQPLDPAQKPKVHEPALNHLGLWVDDLAAAHRWLSEQGMRFAPGGIRKGASGYDICFLHPKPSEQSPRSGEGVLIELVQAPAEVIAAFAALVP